MICSQCGTQLDASTRYCTHCGAPTTAGSSSTPLPTVPGTSSSLNAFAVVSLVLGVLGGWLFALVFGYVGRTQIKRSNGRQRGSGLAIAGIVLGWIGVAATVVVVLVLIVAASSGSSSGSSSFNSASANDSYNGSPYDNSGTGSDTGGFTVVTTTTQPLTTTTTPTSFGTYRITDSGVIIRTGPGTTYPEIGRIPPEVFVPFYCRVSGEGITGPYNGPPGDPWWDKTTYNGITGFVTDEYVDNQADVSAGRVLPPC